jgi:hypothetical protein
MPSILAMVPLSLVLLLFSTGVHLGFYRGSYLSAAILLFGASCQWLLVGHRVDQWLVHKRWGNWPRQLIHRRFRFLVAAIVITTLIMTPILSDHSRRLGLRHAGISFR